MLNAAIAAGAPKDIIGWIDEPSVALSNALMHHDDINLILATGGPGMVKPLTVQVNLLSVLVRVILLLLLMTQQILNVQLLLF